MKIFLALTLIACEQTSPFPITIEVHPENHEEAFRIIEEHTADLNNRLGCQSVAVLQDDLDYKIRWSTWPEMIDCFGWSKNAGGVSTYSYDNDGKFQIWIATDELPAELSQSGKLSPCETGYLWVFWIGRLAGLRTQYSDTSKITYGHPNCPGYIPDIVGELITELEERKIDICGVK